MNSLEKYFINKYSFLNCFFKQKSGDSSTSYFFLQFSLFFLLAHNSRNTAPLIFKSENYISALVLNYVLA
jgi:hypothetical protein